MLTGEIRNQIDRIWDSFWSGGISNPLEVIEQITYLLFLRRLDEQQQLEELKAKRLGTGFEKTYFPEGKDRLGRDYQDLRWSKFKNFDPKQMYDVVSNHVFPFLREMGDDGTSFAKSMESARFTIPTPQLLAKVVDLIDKVPMDDRDTKGDLYEYMLGKIASAGQNGQFRTPRHIIQLMVELTAPKSDDVICDPASGTCGFLVAAGEYIRQNHPTALTEPKQREHFHHGMFHGYDFDNTMLRIGSMNMMLHGVEDPDISYRDSLSGEHTTDGDRFTLLLANPPFAGSLDYESTAKDLLRIVKTKKTELLFLALFLKFLKPGGRAAVIVPDGVLFGSSTAHKELRRMLVEDHKLDGVVSLPSGVFKPYAGVSTAILLFTKTNSGGTDNVWFYDMKADGWSLDDKRQPLLSEDKLGPIPKTELTTEEHEKNNLPDVLQKWNAKSPSTLRGEGELSSFVATKARNDEMGVRGEGLSPTTGESVRYEPVGVENLNEDERLGESNPRTSQSFTVSKSEIAANGYDLSINRYKQVIHEEVEHRDPKEILAELWKLEEEIQRGMKELEAML